MLVGQSPGSATDIVARLMAAKMSQSLGQSIVVENRAGAGGVVAASSMAQAKPDGYSILMTTASQTSLAPHLMKSLPYDPFRDFTYIAPVTDVAMLLVASPTSGIGNYADLVKMAKANPGKINFGSSGLGSASHLSLEMLAQLAGIKLSHIPYKGTGPAITSVIAGETSLHVNALGNLIPLVQSGKVVPIALLTDQRSARLPEVPSLTDLNVKMPRVASWIGLVGPAGLPQPITEKLVGAVQAAKNDPEIKQKFLDLGLMPFDGSGQDFSKRAEEDSRAWGKLIHDQNIQAD
jgi:tripartite-type tricarboxylate transporter receptor subunit TctC